MPSALRASRDFLAQQLARVRAGISAADRSLGEEGPEISVEPFDARNVSTSAGLIKLGTSIAAARRHRANWEAARQERAIEREKARAEIARIRAQEKYYLGEGRQSTGAPPRTLSTAVGPYPAGTPISDVNVSLRERGLQAAREAREARARQAGRVSAASAGLRELDLTAKTRAQELANRSLQSFGETFKAAAAGDAAALQSLEIDPEDFADAYGTQKSTMLSNAKTRMYEHFLRLASESVAKDLEPKRRSYQEVIDRGAQGFEADEDLLGFEDQDDPLGLFTDQDLEEP
jgi:hypothetical protein